MRPGARSLVARSLVARSLVARSLVAGSLTAALALAAPLAIGCGPPRRRPMPDPWSYLRVGVEPEEEAEEVSRLLLASGHQLGRRVEGEGYVAMSFFHPEREEVAIRVVTYRGVALALDSAPPMLGGAVGEGRLRLLPSPVAGGDLDGDHRPELLVSEQRRGGSCLLVFRVQANGAVEPVSHEARQIAPWACIEGVEDLDGDGSVELLAALRLPASVLGELSDLEGRPLLPEVPLALRWEEGRLLASDPSPSTIEAVRRPRLRELDRARATFDAGLGLRIAMELALLRRAEGSSPADQVRVFDETMAGLVLTEALAVAARRGRGEIEAGWPSLREERAEGTERGIE